jgi:hypothetical protein
MSRIRKLLSISGIALLIVATIMGCTRMFWNLGEQEGGYIRVNVGQPGAKGIDVDYHDVTGLSITVYDPGEAELATFQWDAEDGPQSYVVEVNTTGTYGINVTHVSDANGELVEATETAEFDIEAMVITVINVTPGAIGMIEVEGGDGEEEINLTGYWAGFADIPDEGVQGPHLIYFVQTGNALEGYDGESPFWGTVDGTDVELTFSMGEEPITVYGTIDENGEVHADFVWLEPLEFTCGSLVLEGFYELNSTCALGAKHPDEMKYSLDFDIVAEPLNGRLMFWNDVGFAPGVYPLDVPAGEIDTDAVLSIGFDGNYWDAEGTLVVEPGPSILSGSFDLSFEEEDYLIGSFALDYPNWGGATVTVDAGRWEGMDVMSGTTSGLWWEQLAELEKGSCEIRHLDENIDVWLAMNPVTVELTEGSFSVPDQVEVRVSLSTVQGGGFEEEALFGTLNITYETDGDGITGSFTNMEFPGGLLSADFDVKYEISDEME